MIKAVIFDCFGVLVGRGFHETYSHAGGDSHKDHEFVEALLDDANRGHISQEEFIKRICDRLEITLEAYRKAVLEVEQPNYELLEYAKKLRKEYKTAVLTNVNVGVLERKIPEPWLKKCFDTTVVSAEVGHIKPEPEIYHYTAKKLGVDTKECVFIDDRQGYVAAARAVGMKAILYKDFEQMKRDLEKILADSKN